MFVASRDGEIHHRRVWFDSQVAMAMPKLGAGFMGIGSLDDCLNNLCSMTNTAADAASAISSSLKPNKPPQATGLGVFIYLRLVLPLRLSNHT